VALSGETNPVRAGVFPTTAWSDILAAGRQPDGSGEALARLCAAYWFPTYAYMRRRGFTREAAEDLTQEFFACVLENGFLAGARRDRGRFRSFLLASVRNFLANEWDRTKAQKRGGNSVTFSLDFDAAEGRYHQEPFHELTPEALFERQWAYALLDRVLGRLRAEYAAKGQSEQFNRWKPCLYGEQERGAYHQIAIELEMSEAAVKTAVYRFRQRYAELVREEIGATVAKPDEVEEEIQHLLAVLGGP
jgi:RNA polymerase sigma-70 factor (ECF subfamily)